MNAYLALNFPPNSIGDGIRKLVERYGRSTVGIYQLQMALAAACKPEGDARTTMVMVDGRPVGDSTGYRMLDDREAETLARIEKSMQLSRAA